MENKQLELKTTQLSQVFAWNFEELKADLSGRIEKYRGLVVTDENLQDMEKTKREIAGLRVKIGKFKTQVKSELDKPYKKFESQIKELLLIVEDAEKPISEQLDVYEEARKEEKSRKIRNFIAMKAADIGLELQYTSQIVVSDKWLNRTQKWSDTEDDVLERIARMFETQRQDREAATFRAEKVEMAKFMCETLSKDLATPLTFAEIENRIDNFNLAELKEHITNLVASRKEREEKAARIALEKAAEQQEAKVSVVLPEEEKTVSQQQEKRCIVNLVIDVNKEQYQVVKEFLASKGISYTVAAAKEVA